MSWRERDYASDDDPMRRFGRPGGDWRGLRPSFDNPMTWSVPVGRVLGIGVRVHLIFVIFLVAEILRAAMPAAGGAAALWPTVIVLASLFVIVLLHEFGHCLACRWAGGEADEVLMWPLGGLAFTRPPNTWRAHLITVVGGPAVNVAIALVLVPLLGVLTGRWWGVALPNPFGVGVGLYDPALDGSWLLYVLYLAGWVNLVLLMFNVLVPMFPLDGGRILQAVLWRRFGYVPSMRLSVRLGYVAAILLCVFGLVIGRLMLVAIAVFGGITCWITHKQLEFTQVEMGLEGGEFAGSLWESEQAEGRSRRPGWRQRRAARRAERERLRIERESAALDDILQKINRTGMDSLSAGERRLLREATRRRQGQR